MARGDFRERTRESQKKKRDLEEYERLRGGGRHKLVDPGGGRKRRRMDELKKSLKITDRANLPSKISKEDKGKGPASNRVGSKPDKSTWPKGDDYKPGDLTKKPRKAVYSPSLGRNVTGAGIKAKAAADRKEMLAKEEREKKHKTLLHKTEKQDTAKTQSDELASLKKKLKRHASGKNSVAKTKLKLKIRKLEGK